MTAPVNPYPHFRLNLEQQRKRAKELLAAARAGDANALERLVAAGAVASAEVAPKLAAAQFAIARELRFASWGELKTHVTAMTRERRALETSTGASRELALDADLPTLHVRCGSDIELPLRAAGFGGDFYEHSYPYLIGPVREGPGALEQRAAFLVASSGDDEEPLVYDRVLESLAQAERRLEASADYDRVVIWSEHDCYDQLVQLRLLGHYATHRRPRRLELVNLNEFPGAIRFLGLGQLPPEALRLLWSSRTEVGEGELRLGRDAWRALASPAPRALARIARSGTKALPLLAPALRRHLAELPALETGLSATERMALEVLARGAVSLNRVFAELTYEIDPLPGQADTQVRDRVLAMERAREPLLTRTPGFGHDGRSRPPWTDRLTITATGRATLGGDVDYLSLDPPPRWVGGVQIGGGNADWRWDERSRDVVLRKA